MTLMYGRFTLRRDIQRVRRELRVEAGGGDVLWEPRYNIAPTDQVPILSVAQNGQRKITPMVWGIPRNAAAGWSGRSTPVRNRSQRASPVAS